MGLTFGVSRALEVVQSAIPGSPRLTMLQLNNDSLYFGLDSTLG